MGKPLRKDTAEIMRSSLAGMRAAVDDLPCDYEVLRAIVMTLLAAYYRSRPGDTRFEKKALTALPAEHRATGSVQLGQIIDVARNLARKAEA